MNAAESHGFGAVIQAAREGGMPVTVDPNVPNVVMVPDGARPDELVLDRWRAHPTRARGHFQVATVKSFVDYVANYAVETETTVWVNPTSGQAVAIIDDHSAESPGWADHRCTLQLEETPEWTHWAQQDNVMMDQESFAEHIEVGVDDIVEPVSASVLELAQSFHARSSAAFRSAVRLETGEMKFQYDETITATAGKTGELEIPKAILLGIAPFVGEDPYKVVARLRYRLNGGKLGLGYKLDKPDRVVRDCLESIAEKLEKQFPLTFIGYGPSSTISR